MEDAVIKNLHTKHFKMHQLFFHKKQKLICVTKDLF